ncbi:MAG: hypothetical protein Q8P48_07665 [Deltaproteobacteria bacterium]|nr:hypothetical protein [Deltaproteobacteria bacterium]
MKFTVRDRHIKHDGNLYAPGDVIELAAEEAGRLGDSIEPVKGSAVPKDSGDERDGKKVRKGK